MTVESSTDSSKPDGGDGVYTPTFGFESDYRSRIVRALTTRMTISELAPDLYLVETDDDAYHVDLEGRVCECPDCEYRDMVCKHAYRVILETEYGIDPYPLWEDSELVGEEASEQASELPEPPLPLSPADD